MRLVTYRVGGTERFGALRGGEVVALPFVDALAYLDALPGSFETARLTLGRAEEGTPLAEVELLAPVPRPRALLDAGLSPRHLRRSARVLLRRSVPLGLGWPLGWALGAVAGRSRAVRYYKGNHHTVSGPGAEIPWPAFTAYLDIEPELAFVVGAGGVIGGYLVFNDASARDVQLGESLLAGPSTSKDFADGNGFGPWLVTPDEVPDPLALSVTVDFGGRPPWRGTTADYWLAPAGLLAALTARRPVEPGTLIGLGTIPGCCGLDRDEWLEPGEAFAITIDGLGTLRQGLGRPASQPLTSWTQPGWRAG